MLNACSGFGRGDVLRCRLEELDCLPRTVGDVITHVDDHVGTDKCFVQPRTRGDVDSRRSSSGDDVMAPDFRLLDDQLSHLAGSAQNNNSHDASVKPVRPALFGLVTYWTTQPPEV